MSGHYTESLYPSQSGFKLLHLFINDQLKNTRERETHKVRKEGVLCMCVGVKYEYIYMTYTLYLLYNMGANTTHVSTHTLLIYAHY